MNRRDFHRIGSYLLGGAAGLLLAVPGAAYLFDPLFKRQRTAGFHPLAKLSELKEGVPTAVSVVAEHQDSWAKYPKEPIGSVWLVRQPAGSAEPVVAFTSACPHLSCAINLSADRKNFYCACHSSSFSFAGKPMNKVPPRPMDSLDVKVEDDVIHVKFQRFRPQAEEKIPLA